MKIKTFLRAIDPEVYVRLEHIDGHNVAFNQAESLIKHGDPRFDVVGAYPESYEALGGRLGITILVEPTYKEEDLAI